MGQKTGEGQKKGTPQGMMRLRVGWGAFAQIWIPSDGYLPLPGLGLLSGALKLLDTAPSS